MKESAIKISWLTLPKTSCGTRKASPKLTTNNNDIRLPRFLKGRIVIFLKGLKSFPHL